MQNTQRKRLISASVLENAAKKYIEDKKANNIAKLSKLYGIPYSTLRRYLLNYIEENNLSGSLIEDYLPYEGFEYLNIDDTFQFSEHLTIWLVQELKKIDGDTVFVIVPAPKTSKRHWICDELTVNGDLSV